MKVQQFDEPLDGPDYVEFVYWDETSQFDDHPTKKWCPGTDCYQREYRCRVPSHLSDEGDIHEWIWNNIGRVVWL